MKRTAIILLNLILISIIAFLAFKGNMQDITGHVIASNKEVVETTIVTLNIKDLETGETFQPNDKKEVFFISENIEDFEEKTLILSGSKNLFIDVDGNGTKCSKNNYIVKIYYHDKNGNREFDGSEQAVYSSMADEDGCVGADLPKDDYYLVFGDYKGKLTKTLERHRAYQI